MTQFRLPLEIGHETPFPSLAEVPPPPVIVRYYDDFARTQRTLRTDSENGWVVEHNGAQVSLALRLESSPILGFVKLALVEALTNLATATTIGYHGVYNRLPPELMTAIVQHLLSGSPMTFRQRWIVEFRDRLTRQQAVAVRHLARTACRLELGEWRNSDLSLVRELPGHYLDKYAGILDGSAFLSVKARSLIIEFIDSVSREIQEGQRRRSRIRDAAILAIAFQYGLRTKQIASIEPEDLKFFGNGALHIRIGLIKQRGAKVGRTVTRRVQQGWVSIFAAWVEVRPPDAIKLFGLRPDQLGELIQELTSDLTGTGYTSRDLRHTAAQRLVDGGASRESVSEFLGHTDTTAADVYFTSSPTQGALVNAALGYSPTYQAVAAAGRGDLITATQLLKRPLDEQVSGMPHGIPVSGIGACTSGQSQCRRNPVLACYTCHKFLPVSDAALHRGVLEDLRGVVRSFDQPEKFDRVSGAMTQLRATLEAIEAVVGETEATL